MKKNEADVYPCLDKFVLYLGELIGLTNDKRKNLEKHLKERGIEVRRKFPKREMKNDYVIISNKALGVWYFTWVIQGNGFRYLKDRLEPGAKSYGQDKMTNYFHDSKLYLQSEQLLMRTILFLEGRIKNAEIILESVFQDFGSAPPQWKLSFYLELAYDHYISSECAPCEMLQIYRRIGPMKKRTLYFEAKSDSTEALGIRYPISKHASAHIYRRPEGSIRYEERRRKESFKASFPSLNRPEDLREIVMKTVPEWQAERLRVMNIPVDRVNRLPSSTAHSKFIRVARGRSEELIKLLLAGEGRVRCLSNENRNLYKAILRLSEERILRKDIVVKGSWYLTPEYESIFYEFPIESRLTGLLDLQHFSECCGQGLAARYVLEKDISSVQKMVLKIMSKLRDFANDTDRKLGFFWASSIQKYCYRE
jgi:hypothetical protein